MIPIILNLCFEGFPNFASIWAAIGLGSLALQDRLDLPGMNVEGTHLPGLPGLSGQHHGRYRRRRTG